MAPTPAVKTIQSFEVAYDEDLNDDGDIDYTITVQSVAPAG